MIGKFLFFDAETIYFRWLFIAPKKYICSESAEKYQTIQSAEKYQTIQSAEKWWVIYGELQFFPRFD